VPARGQGTADVVDSCGSFRSSVFPHAAGNGRSTSLGTGKALSAGSSPHIAVRHQYRDSAAKSRLICSLALRVVVIYEHGSFSIIESGSYGRARIVDRVLT
jgi:hypothetical protein